MNKTANYDIFKKHPANRPLNEKNLSNIMESLQRKNLLQFRPILVDANMQVLEGQHRLEAAKRLNLEVYYVQCSNTDPHDVVLFNCMKKWDTEDYLNFYICIGNDNYIKLRDFIAQRTINLGTFLFMFRKYGGSHFKEFREGKFIFPSPEELKKNEEIMGRMEEITALIKSKYLKKNRFVETKAFEGALHSFLKSKNLDYKKFLYKLSYQIEAIHQCTNYARYVDMFLSIYNFKCHNPISKESIIGVENEPENTRKPVRGRNRERLAA